MKIVLTIKGYKMSTYRSRYSDEERIEFVTMDLVGKPISELKKHFQCSEFSIYQARRSAWYQLLIVALVPYIGDQRASKIGATVPTNNKLQHIKGNESEAIIGE